MKRKVQEFLKGSGARVAFVFALAVGVLSGLVDAAVAGLVAAAMTVKAIESQGIVIKVSTIGSPSIFSTVPNVTGFRGPGGAASVIDVTNLSSTAKEKLMGLPDEGQFSFDLNYDPDDSVHQSLRNARSARTRVEFQITFTDTTPSTAAFYAYVLGFEIAAQVDQQVKASVTCEIDGAVSWA